MLASLLMMRLSLSMWCLAIQTSATPMLNQTRHLSTYSQAIYAAYYWSCCHQTLKK